MSDETAEIEDVHCVNTTEKAIRIRTAGDDYYWIPQSVIHDDSEVFDIGDHGTLVVAEWFAVKEGLV